MKHDLKSLLLASILVPGVAIAQINTGDDLGLDETSIRAALVSQGYTVTEFEVENGEIEVDVMKGGMMFEIEVSADTGLVLAIEEDDSDDDQSTDPEEDDDDNDNDD